MPTPPDGAVSTLMTKVVASIPGTHQLPLAPHPAGVGTHARRWPRMPPPRSGTLPIAVPQGSACLSPCPRKACVPVQVGAARTPAAVPVPHTEVTHRLPTLGVPAPGAVESGQLPDHREAGCPQVARQEMLVPGCLQPPRTKEISLVAEHTQGAGGAFQVNEFRVRSHHRVVASLMQPETIVKIVIIFSEVLIKPADARKY